MGQEKRSVWGERQVREVCPLPGRKYKYASKADARRAARIMSEKLGLRRMFVYSCDTCRTWHITKQERPKVTREGRSDG